MSGDTTVEESLNGKDPKTASSSSSLYEWCLSSSKKVSNSFQTNKTVRYSIYGTGAAAVLGIAGLVLYLKK